MKRNTLNNWDTLEIAIGSSYNLLEWQDLEQKTQRAGNHHTLLTRRQHGQTGWGNICCVLNGEEQTEHVTVYNPVILLLSLSFLKQRRITNLHEALVSVQALFLIPTTQLSINWRAG